MSEPLKPEEVVKFGDQMRKLWGWFRKWFKKAPTILLVVGIFSVTYSCDAVRGGIRIINTIPIPEPNPTAIPLPPGRICGLNDCDCWHDPLNERDYDWAFIACPKVTPTSTPVLTPTPVPTIAPTVEPTPTPVSTPNPNWKYPIIGFQKIQGYNPKPGQKYNCHNPEDGPKFLNQHICVKDSTRYLCDPNNPGNCGPCDTDHGDNWNGFCLEQDYDPVKIRFTAKNATVVETDNPSQWEVHFTPGVPFTACAAALPFGQDRSTSGLQLEQKNNTETCVTETYH